MDNEVLYRNVGNERVLSRCVGFTNTSGQCSISLTGKWTIQILRLETKLTVVEEASAMQSTTFGRYLMISSGGALAQEEAAVSL